MGPAWLRGYHRTDLSGDLIAGVMLAAYLLPAGIADASLAGLPPQAGLYACLFGGMVFWALCSSKHTAITVTSAISILVGTAVGELSGGDEARHVALAMATCLLVGALGVAAWAARAGMIVNFVSETVLTGFKCGIAFVLAGTQIPKLLGFPGGHGSFWSRLEHIITHIGETHPASLALGLTALIILLAGKKLLPGKPVALAVVVSGIAATTVLQLHDAGVKVLGNVPQGLPALGLPDVNVGDLNGVVPIAFACFLLAAVESAAIGRMFALKYGYRFDANRELLAIGGANVLAGLGRGFPVSGGMSQSLVNESSGARTPMSGAIATVVILVVVLWFSQLLQDLPQPVLAAIVLAAVTGLFKIDALKRLWRFSKIEFAIAGFAFLGVLGQGILRGVAIGVLLSLFALLRRASAPNVVEVGRIGESNEFASFQEGVQRSRVRGVLVARIDGSLLYFNAEHARDRLVELLAERDDATRLILYLGAVPAVDLAGADMVIELAHALQGRGIDFRVAGAHTAVRDKLALAGFDASAAGAYRSVVDALG